mgnify:CR=1 FL=1
MFNWIWTSTYLWFYEPIPTDVGPWRFWARLILWAWVVWLVIVPICFVLACLSIVVMSIYAGLFRFHILREPG